MSFDKSYTAEEISQLKCWWSQRENTKVVTIKKNGFFITIDMKEALVLAEKLVKFYASTGGSTDSIPNFSQIIETAGTRYLIGAEKKAFKDALEQAKKKAVSQSKTLKPKLKRGFSEAAMEDCDEVDGSSTSTKFCKKTHDSLCEGSNCNFCDEIDRKTLIKIDDSMKSFNKEV